MPAVQQSKENSSKAKQSNSESGLASSGSVEVIGLLGLATLIYATLALVFIF